MLYNFLKFLIVMLFVFLFHVVTLATLLIPIDKLYFQFSNCNVFLYVSLAYVSIVSAVTVLYSNVFCHAQGQSQKYPNEDSPCLSKYWKNIIPSP